MEEAKGRWGARNVAWWAINMELNGAYVENEQIHLLWYGRVLHHCIEDIDNLQENRITLVLKPDENTEREGRYIVLPQDLFPKKLRCKSLKIHQIFRVIITVKLRILNKIMMADF